MYSTALQQTTQQELLSEWVDLWFSEYKKAGYVAITDFEKQFFYGANDIQKIIATTAGKAKKFISINAFDVNWNNREFTRHTEALKQIRNIAIDIDQYKLGLTIEAVLNELRSLVASDRIPEPNLILTSRGVQLFYSIDRGASPEMAWLASYITEQLISKLEHLGADSNAKDMSRVMRVPNSVNERNNALVKPSIWKDTAYSLQELQSYCRPLEEFTTRKQTKAKVIHLPQSKKLQQFYKTNYARLADLTRLIELRQGDFTGMRNVLLYMYSFHQSLVLNTQKDVVRSVTNTFKDVYSRTDKPMTQKEFETTIRSAYKDAETFFNAFKASGFNVRYKANDGIKKPYTTKNVIKKLSITEKEQDSMQTLHSPEIRKKKRAEYMRKKRRSEGMGTMEEYNQTRQAQQAERVTKLADLLEKYPEATQRELAEIMDVSAMTVNRLLKIINR